MPTIITVDGPAEPAVNSNAFPRDVLHPGIVSISPSVLEAPGGPPKPIEQSRAKVFIFAGGLLDTQRALHSGMLPVYSIQSPGLPVGWLTDQ